MVPNVLVYQFLLVALVLIYLIIHVWCPDHPSATPQIPTQPDKPRRKRTVDTQAHFCPKPDCSYQGWLGRGNIRSNGHPGGEPWRQLQCVSCEGYFCKTDGTMFQGNRSAPDLIVYVIVCLAEGLGIRGTARVFEIDSNAVLSWGVEAAEQLQAFSSYFLRELHLHQVQLDELYAVRRVWYGPTTPARYGESWIA